MENEKKDSIKDENIEKEEKNEEKEPIDALKEKDEEIKILNDKYLRVHAEFENFKKRKEKELREFKSYANEAVFFDMLMIIDNLERAIESAESSESDPEGLLEGVKLTLKEIIKIFEKHGVTQIKALGEKFDPALHQAVMREESENDPENTVIKELQKGYVFKERLLRPSMVAVSTKS